MIRIVPPVGWSGRVVLVACWWARVMVASTETVQSIISGGVGLGQDLGQYPVPGAVRGIPAVAFPHRLPRAELLPGQVPPLDPGRAPVDDPVHDLPVFLERTAPAGP